MSVGGEHYWHFGFECLVVIGWCFMTSQSDGSFLLDTFGVYNPELY